MALYGRELYGQSFYGENILKTGAWTSQVFNINNGLIETTNINTLLVADLPKTIYSSDDGKIKYSGTWKAQGIHKETASHAASYQFKIWGKDISIKHSLLAQSDPAIKISIQKDGQTTNLIVGPGLWDGKMYTEEYAEYTITVSKNTNNNSTLGLEYIECTPVEIEVEFRTKAGNAEWSEWNLVPLLEKSVSNRRFLFENLTVVSNVDKYQVRIVLATSDLLISPAIPRIEIECGNFREESGTMECVLAFDNTLFKEFGNINFQVDSIDHFSIRTQSSTDGTNWTNLSSPYILGGEDQIRLRETYTTGTILSKEMTSPNLEKWLQYRDKAWHQPLNDIKIVYEILIYQDGNFVEPYYNYQYSPQENYTNIKEESSSNRIKIKATLSRPNGYAISPKINSMYLGGKATYTKGVNIPFSISAVSNNFTGREEIISIEDLDFSFPEGVGNPVYRWVNNTEKNYINLYWKNQDSFFTNATDHTSNPKDILCVKCDVSKENVIHSQGLSTMVIYPNIKRVNLKGKQFAPVLKEETSYDFFLTLGRLDTDYKLITGSTKEKKAKDINWSKSDTWDLSGDISWDEQYRAWKCTGNCSFMLKDKIIREGDNLYVGKIKVLSFNESEISMKVKQLDETNALVGTTPLLDVQSTSVWAKHNIEKRFIGDYETANVLIEVTVNQSNGSVTYLRDISFLDTDYGRMVDAWWEDEDISNTPKYKWNMVRNNISTNLCFDIYETSVNNALWTSKELVFYNEVVNRNNIKSNNVRTLLSLPEIKPYVKCEEQPYYLSIGKNAVFKNGIVTDALSIEPVEMEFSGEEEQYYEYKLNVRYSPTTVNKVAIIKGSGIIDVLPYNRITDIKVWKNLAPAIEYKLGIDYNLETEGGYITNIIWITEGERPTAKNTYYVDINYEVASRVKIEFTCNDSEPIVYRDLWTSDETIIRYGQLEDGVTLSQEDYDLPSLKKATLVTSSPNSGQGVFYYSLKELEAMFPSAKGKRLIPSTVHYSVRNNNKYIKSIVQEEKFGKFFVTNSIDKDISRKWLPLVHRGHYFLDDKAYYQYVSPKMVIMEPSDFYNTSQTTLPSPPNLNAPIIVKLEDGTFLRKVSFIDKTTGEFVLYNQERVVWDRSYLEGLPKIKVTYSKLELDNFETLLYNYTDIVATSGPDGGLTVGENYILVNIPDETTLYNNAELSIVYKPKDAFSYDANLNRITLSQEYDQNVFIYYEESQDTHQLIEHIDTNPMFNTNHSGFLYIPHEENKVKQIKAHLSDNKVLADGTSPIYINIIPVNEYGNPINSNSITVSLDDAIDNNGTLSEVKQIGFGEYFCIYTPPLINTESYSQLKYIYLTIKDGQASLKKTIILSSIF